MMNFDYRRAIDATDAALNGALVGSRFIAGGTNLVDLMRESIETPSILVDVSALSRTIALQPDGKMRIGAAATNTAVASDPLVLWHAPLLAQAIVNGASGQIRNMATVGGNIMQRTRCLYFYDHAARCNKRSPNAGCDALEGHHRTHAILGTSPACIATHPSDMCVALAALDANVHLTSTEGERILPFDQLHRIPGDRPDLETNLRHGELITAIEFSPTPLSVRSAYRKVRDRASYAFALVSVAATLDIEDGIVREGRIALGGVATTPWRAREAEVLMVGMPPTEELFKKVAAAAMSQALPHPGNAFKVQMARDLIAATLRELSNLEEAP